MVKNTGKHNQPLKSKVFVPQYFTFRNWVIPQSQYSKLLGLSWDSLCDTLRYDLNLNNHPKRIRKRVILSTISQIFDPLGLISPIVMKAKLFDSSYGY